MTAVWQVLMTVKNVGVRPSALWTTEDVVAYLNVTPRTIYRLIRTGELPAIRIGHQWRIRQSDLDEWLDRQRVAAS
jgi:excisionase family DNA binding protein